MSHSQPVLVFTALSIREDNLICCVELSYLSGSLWVTLSMLAFSSALSLGMSISRAFLFGFLSSSRYILVKFADRGLVNGGYPNLKLSETLTLVIYVSYVTCLYGIFPFSHQIKDHFPAESRKGQLCMQLDFVPNENYTKHRIKQAVFPFLVMIFTTT